jgi:hypothetical protein
MNFKMVIKMMGDNVGGRMELLRRRGSIGGSNHSSLVG